MYRKAHVYILFSFVFANLLAACAVTQAQAVAICKVDTPILNLRTGPSINYARTSQMLGGEQFAVSKRDVNSGWLFGEYLDNEGWASANFLDCKPHDVSELPIAEQQRPNISVFLIAPTADRLSGRITFEWSEIGGTLDKGEVYEIIFWPIGGDPMTNGFGIAPPTTDLKYTVNLDKLAKYEPDLLASGREYQWGVALLRDGERTQFLSDGHKFYFEVSGHDSSRSNPIPQDPNVPPRSPSPSRSP